MKKSRRVFSFLIAIVFCFSAVSFSVLATSYTCGDHPGMYRYDPQSDKTHDVYCSVCNEPLGDENCSDWECAPNYCTKPSYCMMCSQDVNPALHSNHVAHETAYYRNSTYHAYECVNKTHFGSTCQFTLLQVHDFVNGTCVDCGYAG